MTDSSASHNIADDGEPSFASLVADLEPMGDLSRFVIDDLTPEEEDAFFSTLDDA